MTPADIKALKDSHRELMEALEQVMGWIWAWEPNFADDDDWLEFAPTINTALANARKLTGDGI